jgi:hypothetical protein
LVLLFVRLQGSCSTDSHQLGFADASFRFVPLQRLHLGTCQTVVTPPLPISRFFQPLNGWLAFLKSCGFVPPHWHFEGCSLQSLTLHPVGCHLWHLLLPSLFTVSYRVSSLVCVGSLTSWPLSFVPFRDLASPWPLAHRFL